MKESLALENKIKTYFKNKKIVALYLFGSHSQQKQRFDSDVDIGVLYERDHLPDVFEQVSMKEDLIGLVQKEVDLIFMNNASPILIYQILGKGKLLAEKNHQALLAFKVKKFMEYDDLKRLRASIEKNLSKGVLCD